MNYSELREKVERGARFAIDFKKRTVKVNGKKVEFDKDDLRIPDMLFDAMEGMHTLYEHYKYSVPSERSENRHRTYFKALKYEDLNDNALCYGEHRETARFDLEIYVLFFAIHFGWQEEWGSWFYQDTSDKDFVLLREWIEPQAA